MPMDQHLLNAAPLEELQQCIQSLLDSPEVASFHSPDGSRPGLTRSRADRENLQLIHYEAGQMYRLHYDKVEKKPDSEGDGQRKATTRAAMGIRMTAVVMTTVPTALLRQNPRSRL